jgi:hypothetical protein
MGLKYLFSSAILLVCIAASAQVRTDKDFMGIKGPVKQFTSTTYKDIIFWENDWIPDDTGTFSITYTCYFNRGGGVDSMHLWYKRPATDPETGEMKNIVVHERIISEIKNGKKTGSLIYSNSALIRKEQNVRSDNFTTVENTVDSSGKLMYSTQTYLSAGGCPEKSVFTSYDSLGKENYKKVQRWTRDGNCNVAGVEEEADKTIKKYKYEIRKFSAEYYFPLETLIIPEGETAPEKIIYRTVEFY